MDREEAIALGLLTENDLPPEGGGEQGFNDGLEASAAGLRNEDMQRLKEDFRSQIRVEGSRVQWENRQISDVLSDPESPPLSFQIVRPEQTAALAEITGQDVSRYEWSLDGYAAQHVREQHGDSLREAARGQVAVKNTDLESLPMALLGPLRVGQVVAARDRQFGVAWTGEHGGDVFSVWEVRPGRGLKRRLALVSLRKMQGEFMNWAPRAKAGEDLRRAYVLNVPRAVNMTPAQARVKPPKP